MSHGKLPASCQTPRRSHPARASHSLHTCSCSLPMDEHGTEQCKGLHKITGKLPKSQASSGRKRKPRMDATRAAGPPSAPFRVRMYLHYLMLHPYPPPNFCVMPALLQRLAGSHRPQKGNLTAGLHKKGDVENQGGQGTHLIDTSSFRHNFTGWLLPE